MTVQEPVETTGSTRDGDDEPEPGTESVDAVTIGVDVVEEPDTDITDLTPLTGGAADAAVRGVDEILGREVRLVTLPPVSGEVLSDRIEQVRHLARLHHPHLLEVYDVDGLAPDTESTLVLENVSGEPLPLVLREGPIDDADLARMGAQLASALSHAHAHGVQHGAIGPSSVLVDRRRSAAWLVGLTASLSGPLPVIDPATADTPDDEAARRAADVRALARTLADVADHAVPAGDDPEAETLPATRRAPASSLLALLREADTDLPPSAAALSERLLRFGRDATADTDDSVAARLVPVVASWSDPGASPDDATVVAAGPAVRARGANGITPLGVVSGPRRRARRAGVLGAATATLALASGLVIWAGESHVVRQAPQAEVGTALPATAPAQPVPPAPARPASDGSGSSGSSGSSTGSSTDDESSAPPSLVGSTSPSPAASMPPAAVAPPTTESTRVVPTGPTQPTGPTRPTGPTQPTRPTSPPAPTTTTAPLPSTVAPTTTAPTTTVAPTTVAPTTVAPTTVAPTTVAPTTVAPTTVPTTTTTTAAPGALLAFGLPR